MRLISVLSRKGGVGKTALSIGLADALAVAGYRVVLLDVDPGNRTVSNTFAQSGALNMVELLDGSRPLSDAAEVRDNLHLVAGHAALERADYPEVAAAWRRLPASLEPGGFDYAIMDVLAGWHVMCEAAAMACVSAQWGYCLLPVASSWDSFEGATLTAERVASLSAAGMSRARCVLTMRGADWTGSSENRQSAAISRQQKLGWLKTPVPLSKAQKTLVAYSATPSEERSAWALRRAYETLAGEVTRLRPK